MTERLTRTTYAVALEVDGQRSEHQVQVRPVDQMVAEQVASRYGLGPIKDAPISHTIAWIYCALVREKLYAGEFGNFRTDLYAFESGEEVDVDPTTPDTSGSDSPLHFDSAEAPTTG